MLSNTIGWEKINSVGLDAQIHNILKRELSLNHSKILFDPPPREMEIKTKINKWDLMKLKGF